MKNKIWSKFAIITLALNIVFVSCAFTVYGLDNSEECGANPVDFNTYKAQNFSANSNSVTALARYSSAEQKWFPEYVRSRDQHPGGTCWAFCTSNAADISYAKEINNGDITPSSPGHFAYFFYNRLSDPLGLTVGDLNVVKGVGKTWLTRGGGNIYSLQAMANRTGLAEDYAGEYKKSMLTGYKLNRENKNIRVAEDAVVIQPKDFNSRKAYRDAIKSLISEYGAADIVFYWNKKYYNDETHAFCYDKDATPNHAVTVVGWDDNYSKDNFVAGKEPEENGAWIVLNSWGSSWGDNNLFYMSYYDPSSYDEIVAYNMKETEKNEFLYQYDGTAGKETETKLDGNQVAQIFKAQNNIALDAVGFTEMNLGKTQYTVSVYTGCKSDNIDSLTADKAVATMKVNTELPGYHSFKLNKPVSIQKGQKFAVVITFNSTTYMGIEKNSSDYFVKFKAKIHKSQSFYRSSSDRKWNDEAENKACYRIKAVTTVQ